MSPLSRREFVAAGVAAGAGLVIGFYLPHGSRSAGKVFSPNAYLRITPDNKVTIVVARSEMGQGVRTALPMILAEELEADWKQIEIEQAGASTLFGDQTTGGSASIRTTWDPMRKAGAAAREMLITAAALTWNVPRSGCTAENSSVKHAATNRRLTYGELGGEGRNAAHSDRRNVEAEQRLQDRRPAPAASGHARQGEGRSGLRHRLPHAGDEVCRSVALPHHRRESVASFDDKESKKISGVSYVGKITIGRRRGRRQRVGCDGRPPRAERHVGRGSQQRLEYCGSDGVAEARRVEKSCEFIFGGQPSESFRPAHSPPNTPCPSWRMRPWSRATAPRTIQGTKCELWAPTQVPQDCRDSVAHGRRSRSRSGESKRHADGRRLWPAPGARLCGRAALVSKAINAPVKVIWTREDDMRFSTYRPASLHQLSATLDGSGFPLPLDAPHHRALDQRAERPAHSRRSRS
jgi:isoquinoline 1-oxidoreductase subunit beta